MEVTIKNGGNSARIAQHGAELKSLVIGGREFMWCGDPAVWENTAPVMFPMIGTLKDNKTLILGKEYKQVQLFPPLPPVPLQSLQGFCSFSSFCKPV